MEGWLEKQSGGKLQKKGLGNAMSKFDRRFFVLRAGTSTLIKRAKLAGPGSAAKADEARAEQNGTVSLTPQAPAPARKGAPQAGCAC